MHLTGEGPGAILRFEAFLSFINRLLFMGSQRVRHDWATELNWTEWLYNIQLKTSRRALSLPPSEAYVRSFLYLLYTLIKLYYTKALSNQALSLAPDWILLQKPRIPASLRGSATTFHLGGSSRILQDKVGMLGALVLCSLSKHVFCCTLLNLHSVLAWMNETPCAKQVRSPALRSCTIS